MFTRKKRKSQIIQTYLDVGPKRISKYSKLLKETGIFPTNTVAEAA